MGACWVVSSQGGFSLSLFCNYYERVRIAFSMGLFLETDPVEAANSEISSRSAKAGGPARQYVSWDRGTKRHAPVPVPPYLSRFNGIFGFGRRPRPPGYSVHCRGRKRVWHAHVQQHWSPREVEVQEEVTTLGSAMRARRGPERTCAVIGVCSRSRTGGCREVGCGG